MQKNKPMTSFCLVSKIWKKIIFCVAIRRKKTPIFMKILQLTHLFLMRLFSTPWKHQKTVRVTYSWIFRGVRAIGFITIPRSFNHGHTVKRNYKTEDCWSRDFNVLEKGLGLVLRFLYYISRKLFLLSCFVNWPNFLHWFTHFLRYWTIHVL